MYLNGAIFPLPKIFTFNVKIHGELCRVTIVKLIFNIIIYNKFYYNINLFFYIYIYNMSCQEL
jgi:hypothetical protein